MFCINRKRKKNQKQNKNHPAIIKEIVCYMCYGINERLKFKGVFEGH